MPLLSRLKHQVKQKALSLPDIEALLSVVHLLLDERDVLYAWYIHLVNCDECDPPHLCPVGKGRYDLWERKAKDVGRLLNG